jgi:general secretion pathway protein F
LRVRLREAGSVVLAIRASKAWLRTPWPRAIAFDAAWWCRELRTLLVAGMTAVEAIETLAAGADDPARRELHASLLRSLQDGWTLSRAMQGADVFPSVLIAGVAAGERTGDLVEALGDYLRYDDMLSRLKRQATGAAIYPAVVVALGGAISLFLLVYVVPRFARMYSDRHEAVSGVTASVLWLSETVSTQAPMLLAAAALGGLALAWAWISGRLVQVASAVADTISPLSRQLDHFRLAKLYQSLSLMVRGGYPLLDAMQVCEGLDLGRRLGDRIRSARQRIEQGGPASAGFADAGLADAVVERLLRVGERAGSFDGVLRTIAERHALAFSIFVERATRLVEPVLMLLVALVVGSIVVMMYMPIFDIAGGLGAR